MTGNMILFGDERMTHLLSSIARIFRSGVSGRNGTTGSKRFNDQDRYRANNTAVIVNGTYSTLSTLTIVRFDGYLSCSVRTDAGGKSAKRNQQTEAAKSCKNGRVYQGRKMNQLEETAMASTATDENRETPLHKRVRPVNDWHRLLCRHGNLANLPSEESARFNAAVDQIVKRFEKVKANLRLDTQRSPDEDWLAESTAFSMLDLIPDAVISLTPEGNLLYANQVWRSIIPSQQLTSNSLRRLPWRQILEYTCDPSRLIRWVRDAMDGQSVGTLQLNTVDGKSWEVQLHRNQPLPGLVCCTVRDICGATHARYNADVISSYDALTGLPNRTVLLETLRSAVQKYRATDDSHAIFFFDLDGFKFINDSLGHQAGDALLCAVSHRIESLLSENQRLFRLSGDEFIVSAHGIRNLHEVARLAEEIKNSFKLPFVLDQQDIYLGASVGIAVLNDLVDSAEQWVKQADLAMYEAKEAGGQGYAFYNRDIEAEIHKRHRLRADMGQALKDREFTVFYQPKYCLQTNRLCGAEALLRWFRNDSIFVPPYEFIPEAEACGLIVPISLQVFKQVAGDVESWIQRGLAPIVTSLNISPCHFQLADLLDDLIEAFPGSGVPSNRIELEITEGSFLQDSKRSVDKIRTLQRLGFTISIDDFGTGYSSLNYLKTLPADVIKIDRAFVANIGNSDFDATLVQSVINIAHTQGLKVVAEGVEDENIVARLREFDCDQLQGYWYGKPMPRQAFEEQFLIPATRSARMLPDGWGQ